MRTRVGCRKLHNGFTLIPLLSPLSRGGRITLIGGRILVATDESVEGRHAVQAARAIAERDATEWMVLTVTPLLSMGDVPAGRLVSSAQGGDGTDVVPEFTRFNAWLDSEVQAGVAVAPEVALAFGVPGIEISRMARLREADLIVLGRRARAPDRRLLLGETADAVVRRSDVPVLFVPMRVTNFRRVLVALDGTDRALSVLEVAMAMATRVGAAFGALMVEPDLSDEQQSGLGSPMPRARTARLAELLRRVPGGDRQALAIRRGNPVEEILAQVQETDTDLLVIGYRRGGPPKIIAPTDIARNLLYAAPSAVLTVPL